MIDFLRGILIRKQPMHAVLDVNGVGYALHISLQTFDALPKPGSEVELATRLVVREDSMHLYGFGDEEERAMFELLTSVSGVGAKVAMAVLSGSSVAELRDHIGTSNVGALKSIPGIGKKTAERIVLELKDKLAKTASGTAETAVSGGGDARQEAYLALVALGFSPQAVESAMRKVRESAGPDIPTGEVVKQSLVLLRR